MSTKDMTTPRPWHVGTRPEYDVDYLTADRMVGGPTGRDEYDREAGVWAEDDGEGYTICRPDNQADAELIVRAVNSHDDLLATCKALLNRVEWLEDEGPSGEGWQSAGLLADIEAAKVAIAKASAPDPN